MVKSKISSFLHKNRGSGWLLVLLLLLSASDVLLRAAFPLGNVPVEDAYIKLIISFPIFATISLITRQVVGIETFGLFGPAVLGVSFFQTGVLKGLAIYGPLLIIGILANNFLRRYRTLTSARINLTLFFTIIVILPFVLARNLDVNETLMFFPMLITVHIMERFSTTLENNDFPTALQVLLSTLLGAVLSGLVAVLMFFYLNLTGFVYFFFLFLALALSVSSYSGLRLLELARFKLHFKEND